jgi:o-succinylbenzoate---CoA ligase
MSLKLARCLDAPEAFWEELQAHWRRGHLVGLARPEEEEALLRAVLAPRAGTGAPGDARGDAAWGPAVVLGSGGSSGGRRWCLQPLSHLQASATATAAWLAAVGIEAGSCLHLAALPLHHVSGLLPVVRAMQWRAELRWLPPELLRQPGHLADACLLPSGRPVLLSLVPTQLRRLLQVETAVRWLRGCSVIWVGGAALERDLAEQARRAGLPLAPCYGATETAAMVCALPPDRFLAGEEGCGALLADVELRLEGEEGAIAVRTERISPGWFQAGALQRFRDDEGWWRSGDAGAWIATSTAAGEATPAGQRGAAGCSLVIRGRLDGALHSGGETVFPEQVRQHLLGLIRAAGMPVAELLLLAEADALWGERLVALVRWQTASPPAMGGAAEAEALARLKELARALPPSHRPGRWLPCPTLSTSEAGKWSLAAWRHWLHAHPAARH